MPTLIVDQIYAKSDVPLYIINGSSRIIIKPDWQVLWPPKKNSHPSAAFNLSKRGAAIDFLFLCRFSSDLVGGTYVLEGLLRDTVAIKSVVVVRSTEQMKVEGFVRVDARNFPVAYRGSFEWRLKTMRSRVVLRHTKLTHLELYTVSAPSAALWRSSGVSVNLLRQYAAPWNKSTVAWQRADFYRFITQKIFGSPFKYDNVRGASRYTSNTGGSYKLDQYIRELERGSAVLINCYDMAGIVQIVLSLLPAYNRVRWNFMQPYGWINTTKWVTWSYISPSLTNELTQAQRMDRLQQSILGQQENLLPPTNSARQLYPWSNTAALKLWKPFIHCSTNFLSRHVHTGCY
jgi:hypothetical protein